MTGVTSATPAAPSDDEGTPGASERPIAADVTVVIPTIGRPLIEGCLETLFVGELWPSQTIVVDQSRSDDLLALVDGYAARGMPVTYVPSAKRGPAAGTNTGLKRATTRFVARTDDDCLVSADWIRHIAALLTAHGDVVITGSVAPIGEGEVPSVITDEEPVVYTAPNRRNNLYTNNFATTRAVIDTVGLFDEHPLFFPGAEDNDWAHRALRAGFPLRYEPTLRVEHVAWRSPEQLEQTYRNYAAAQGALLGKWIRLKDAHMFWRTIRTLASGPIVVIRSLLQGDRTGATRAARSIRHLWPALVRALVARGWR